ncbi:helicase [Prevotella sp. P5-126]|uniref:helicase-related protein n=1 Tax=Prevotella sp. P5-126 TaxID=2024216 RepID=UPI000B96393E|nr:helicase-related protein [Prevotella sp. P5-126]OYP35274.1 helicase [Prevotella sp. P5-126]
MELINNINKTLRDDIVAQMKAGSRLSIAASCFSIYAFQELKEALKDIKELRFIFTSPTFTTEKTPKQQREFYIPRLDRERTLYGSEFEVKLRNELTQKAIARECAEWIREKACFKSNKTNEQMMGFINLDDISYSPINGFTTVDLGCEKGNAAYTMIQKAEAPFSKAYIDLFNQIWNDSGRLQVVTEEVIDSISNAYKENAPEFLYFVALYNIFNEFLEDISEDELPKEATGFKNSAIWEKLYNFQRDAALAVINKLEKYNGCILADSVGLGKTFTALSVIKYFESRNRTVLVLCPKKLFENWNTYRQNYVNNPLAKDRLNYDILYHTDLSREHGRSNDLDLERVNWGNYDLVVIDESHNFRNGGKVSTDENGENPRENRYLRLMNKVIRSGVKTKVLMLSATPVNNRFNDLKNQLQLAYEGESEAFDKLLPTNRGIDDIFRQAQGSYNIWADLPPEERTTERLLRMLDFDFFRLLDAVTIARSRKHIQQYYDTADIGTFPERMKPISRNPHLTDLDTAINYNEIFEQLQMLHLAIYAPSAFILPSQLWKYKEEESTTGHRLSIEEREQGIQRLMNMQLLKRLESSVNSFRLTLTRIRDYMQETLDAIASFQNGERRVSVDDYESVDGDEDEQDFTIGKKKNRILLEDMDYISWQKEIKDDLDIIRLLLLMLQSITPEHDSKLQQLITDLKDKFAHPINGNNKKVLVFTAFSDTAEYLYNCLADPIKKEYGLNVALVTGDVEARSTLKLKEKLDFNKVLTLFSPISKEREAVYPHLKDEIDVLIATDCISEGQNLQDCDYLLNYDIHWNPVRIIQRFGRIDRIGSKNAQIQLVNYWPDMTLDEYINLKGRVESRMKVTVMTATGDDNLLSPEEKDDLEYRKQQLERLKEDVVDLEEMNTGVSIMDLGLNEFRLDLLEYINSNHDVEHTPFGLHAVVHATDHAPAGTVFVLKNRTAGVNIDHKNQLHPFYMVYIKDDGEVFVDHLHPKDLLDKMRLLCKPMTKPDVKLCSAFNKETRDGLRMGKYSELLGRAIESIVTKKEESDIDSFLDGYVGELFEERITGLDDFELICFLVIR